MTQPQPNTDTAPPAAPPASTLVQPPASAPQHPVGPYTGAPAPQGPGSLYEFRGGAGTWFVTELVGTLLTVFTLGFGYPFAVVMKERWRAENTYLNGRQLKFVGTGAAMFGLWVKWFLLCVVTLGIYSFWVAPRMTKWRTENTVLA